MALKSFLRSLGVGGAEIDAVLDTDQVRPGQTITGTLTIRGGDPDQTASHARLDIVARVVRKHGDDEHQVDEVIAGTTIAGPFKLGTSHTARFSLALPGHTPVTALGGRNFVWLRSSLDVPWALDPTDTDRLTVHPSPVQDNILEAMGDLGFRLAKVDIDARSAWFGRKWVQEFEFRPASFGQRRYDEVEIVFEEIRARNAELLIQLDRAARGLGGLLAEMTGTDESWRRVTVDGSSRAAAAATLRQLIG